MARRAARPDAREPRDQFAGRCADRAWRLAYQRPITPEERDWAREFIDRQLAALARPRPAAIASSPCLTNLCQQLLISNEFLYVD